AVLDQVAHGKILDHDHLVFADESSGQLVQEVLPAVGDAGMHPGHLLTGLGPVRAALLLTGQPPLGFGHIGPLLALVLGVGHLLARGQAHQRGAPGVHPHHTVGGGVVVDPTATAALTNSTPSFSSSNTSMSAFRPASSPPPVHQEKTSICASESSPFPHPEATSVRLRPAAAAAHHHERMSIPLPG